MFGRLLLPAPALAAAAGDGGQLPFLGPAPPFVLTSQDGKAVTLDSLRGKVVVVAFFYTGCPDICPLMTGKMVEVQDGLGTDFGSKVAFVSITLDPEHDIPSVLSDYARQFGVKSDGWAFVTGPPDMIRGIADRYGVYFKRNDDGSIDHTQLTTLIDANGQIRVQYLGVRFDPDELLHDVAGLIGKE